MCILCDESVLERLTLPIERLKPGDLAEAIRDAREAAGVGVLDHAEAVLRGEIRQDAGPELYGEVVVERAVEAGALDGVGASVWRRRLRGSQDDPRVHAFLSSVAEHLDDYRVIYAERRQTIERFLEAPTGALRFGSIGRDGELWFEFRDASYAALTEDEALDIAEHEVAAKLNRMDPEALLRYSTLPDTPLETLARVQDEPEEVANAMLAGIIDVAALAEDRVRESGYAPFLTDEDARAAEDHRFGDWVVVKVATAP